MLSGKLWVLNELLGSFGDAFGKTSGSKRAKKRRSERNSPQLTAEETRRLAKVKMRSMMASLDMLKFSRPD